MSKIRMIPVLALLALVPVPLAAQDQDAQARIDAALARAQDARLPLDLLQSKIREGEAKNVPLDRIAAAVERRAAGLARARAAIQAGGVEQPEPADLAVGAAALEGGVSEAVLAAVTGLSGPETRWVATAALGQLVEMQIMSEDQALKTVTEALGRGAEALANLPAEAARARGLPVPVGFGPSGMGIQAGPPSGVPAPSERPGVDRPGRPGGPPDGG